MSEQVIRTKAVNLKKYLNIAVYIVTLGILIYTWPVTSQLTLSQLQPIASTVATIAGILFGFAMGSMTFLTTAKGITLVENVKKTGYLKKLTSKLHSTMGWLLAVCVIFLITMFIPDSVTFDVTVSQQSKTYHVASAVAHIGVGVLILAFKEFFFTWREFKKFADSI
ncbi:hypothetical protein [Photobacterium sanguinicancri]|uniref:hypothetical protein n=1 Tax=Photobacterium sanguinicancri TaxID=875932 RepID=UPI003D09FD33